MDTKICGKCKTEKPLGEFPKNKAKKDGLQSYCKACRKIAQAAYYRANKEFVKSQSRLSRRGRVNRFTKYKQTLQCSQCDESYYKCLEFHHLDPSKKDFSLSVLKRDHSWDRILEEVDKCVVLCANCHRKAHDGMIVL
jgi:hypothetical protein